MVVKITVANPSGATSATHEGMAFPIQEGAYQTGLTPDGVPYIVAPNGVKLNDPSPVRTATGRGARHGSMVNPVVVRNGASGIPQAFDASQAAYTPASLHDFAAVISPNDAFVKTEGIETIVNQRAGIPLKWAGVHVLAAAPPTNAFAAPFLWPAADKASRPWRVVDVDARLSEIPKFSAAGQSVTPWASLQPYFDRFDLGRGISQATFGGYQEWTTHQSSPQVQSNYDQWLSAIQGDVLTGLMSSGWSSSDHTAGFIRLLQQGCQFGEAVMKDGQVIEADGGQGNSYYAPAMAWLWATGRQAEYAAWSAALGGSNLLQYYFVTAAMLANDFVPHNDPLKPYPYRRRTVIAITNGGLTVEMTGYAVSSGLTQDTASNLKLAGMRLTKESNGNDALITAPSDTQTGVPGTVIVTLASPVAGLAVNDVVYCKANYPLTDGLPQFQVRNFANLRVPSSQAEYLGQNFPTAQRMFVRAIGMAGSNMAAGEAFMEYANAGTHGYSDQVDGSIIGGANPPWVRQFYDANWTTLKALPQDV